MSIKSPHPKTNHRAVLDRYLELKRLYPEMTDGAIMERMQINRHTLTTAKAKYKEGSCRPYQKRKTA